MGVLNALVTDLLPLDQIDIIAVAYLAKAASTQGAGGSRNEPLWYCEQVVVATQQGAEVRSAGVAGVYAFFLFIPIVFVDLGPSDLFGSTSSLSGAAILLLILQVLYECAVVFYLRGFIAVGTIYRNNYLIAASCCLMGAYILDLTIGLLGLFLPIARPLVGASIGPIRIAQGILYLLGGCSLLSLRAQLGFFAACAGVAEIVAGVSLLTDTSGLFYIPFIALGAILLFSIAKELSSAAFANLK